MNILALDSSDKVLSIALSVKTNIWYTEMDAAGSHSQLMLECVDFLCKKASFNPTELNLVSCMKGPGSFTGLRIGFSTAKGLALALGIPLVAIPTLDCIAWSFSIWPGIVIPVIDAKKGCFFSALYRQGRLIMDYADISPESLLEAAFKAKLSPNEPFLLTGYGAPLFYSYLEPFIKKNGKEFEKYCLEDTIITDPNYNKWRAKELLEIAKNVKNNSINDIKGGPVYLRKSDAELNCK